jgi:phosphoribosylanthranilate isomerase
VRSKLPTQIKICGLSTIAAINAAADAGATHIGLVHFPKSTRHVSLKQAATLENAAPAHLTTVLLLVNADIETTAEALGMVRPDVIQFHGSETPEWLNIVKQHANVEIWKALGVSSAQTLIDSERYIGVADKLLFDAPAQALPGGTGTSFDWSLLTAHRHKIPWGLAGGLTPENVASAICATGAQLVDASSGVESEPGMKDVAKIAAFCKAVRDA